MSQLPLIEKILEYNIFLAKCKEIINYQTSLYEHLIFFWFHGFVGVFLYARNILQVTVSLDHPVSTYIERFGWCQIFVILEKRHIKKIIMYCISHKLNLLWYIWGHTSESWSIQFPKLPWTPVPRDTESTLLKCLNVGTVLVIEVNALALNYHVFWNIGDASSLWLELWGVVVSVGDGWHKAWLSIHVVGDRHQATVWLPHAVGALNTS